MYMLISYAWRKGLWHTTRIVTCHPSVWKICFIIISHVDTTLKIILTIVWLVSLLSRKVNMLVIFLNPFVKE